MIESRKFDVFLAHNSKDKPQVEAIAKKLKQHGLNFWLDEEQILPGRSFQEEIQKAIPQVKSAAIFIGSEGLGKWQLWEIRSFIHRCVEEDIPVIPILLPGVDKIPEDLLFLQQFSWLNFDNIDDPVALYQLEKGIPHDSFNKSTGDKEFSRKQWFNINEIFDFLKKQELNPIKNKNLEIKFTIIFINIIFLDLLLGIHNERVLVVFNVLLIMLLLYNLVKRLITNVEKDWNDRVNQKVEKVKEKLEEAKIESKEELDQKFIQSIFDELNRQFNNELYSVSVFVREDWVASCKNPRSDYLTMYLYHFPYLEHLDKEFIETFKCYFGDEEEPTQRRGIAGYVLHKNQIKTIKICKTDKGDLIQSKDRLAIQNFVDFSDTEKYIEWQYDFNFSIYVPIKSITGDLKLGTLCIDLKKDNVDDNPEFYIDQGDEEKDYTDRNNLPKEFLVLKNIADNVAVYLEASRWIEGTALELPA